MGFSDPPDHSDMLTCAGRPSLQAVHLGVAGNDALLHVEALAVGRPLDVGDARVALAATGRGRGGGSCRTGGTLAGGRGLQIFLRLSSALTRRQPGTPIGQQIRRLSGL